MRRAVGTPGIQGPVLRQPDPQHVTGATEVIATPAHSAAIGLLLHGSREGAGGGRVIGGAVGDSVAGFIGKARGWLTRNF